MSYRISSGLPALAATCLIMTAPHATAQDFSLPPTFGIISVTSDFLPDPNWISLLAGGSNLGTYTDAETGGSCAGHFANAPDLRIHFTTGGGYPLSFYVDGEEDTVLLINTPDGQWHCNDDSPLGPWGLDPALTFDEPLDGQYDIWVGTYAPITDDYFPSASVYISELGAFYGMLERSFFGEDDRVVMDTTSAPWNMIGLVEMTQGSCTGALIGPSTVLTAAHCFANEGEADSPPVTFRAGYAEGAEVATSGVTGYHVPRAWLDGEQEGFDFAFMYLSEPLGDRLGWMDVGPLTQGEIAAYANGTGPDIRQAGYSFDEPDYQTGNLDCPFLEVTADNTLSHQCDTLSGDSGSPLFIADGDRFRIIGVESHTDPQPGAEFDLNIAMYSGAVVAEMRRMASGGGTAAPVRPEK